MADELITAADIKERFGFSRGSLLTWERAGSLHPARTPGGQRRYKVKELEQLVRTEGEAQEDKPRFTELGETGLSKWDRSLWEDKLTELRGSAGRVIYREMRLNDPVIAASFFAFESIIKRAMWRVEPCSTKSADKACAEFVSEALFEDMSYSWIDTLDMILMMLEQGFSVLEPVFKRRLGQHPPHYTTDTPPSRFTDGRIGWRKWAIRPAETFVPGDEWEFDDSGGIKGVNQDVSDGKVFLPIEKLLLFRTTLVPAGTPEGRPIHRAAYVPWYYSRNFAEIEGIGVERDLGGIPIVYLGSGTTLKGANSDFELSKDMVVNLRRDEQAGIVIPHMKLGSNNTGEGVLVELLSANSSRAHNVGEIIDRYDRLKALAVLAQFLMLGMQRVGSFALAQVHNDLFTIAAEGWLDKIAQVVNRFAIPKLVRYNSGDFSKITGMPTLVPSGAGLPNLEQLSWYINNLVGRDVIIPDEALERHLRQVAHLPAQEEHEATEVSSRGRDRKANTKDSALILRRVILALRELPNANNLNDDQLMAMLEPLIDQLRLGIESDTGVKIPIVEEGAAGMSETGSALAGSLQTTPAGTPVPQAAQTFPQPGQQPGNAVSASSKLTDLSEEQLLRLLEELKRRKK